MAFCQENVHILYNMSFMLYRVHIGCKSILWSSVRKMSFIGAHRVYSVQEHSVTKMELCQENPHTVQHVVYTIILYIRVHRRHRVYSVQAKYKSYTGIIAYSENFIPVDVFTQYNLPLYMVCLPTIACIINQIQRRYDRRAPCHARPPSIENHNAGSWEGGVDVNMYL